MPQGSHENALEAPLNESEEQSIAQGEPLSGERLKVRLRTGKHQLMRYRDNPEQFAQWSRDKDPDGIAWEYRDGKYFPIGE